MAKRAVADTRVVGSLPHDDAILHVGRVGVLAIPLAIRAAVLAIPTAAAGNTSSGGSSSSVAPARGATTPSSPPPGGPTSQRDIRSARPATDERRRTAAVGRTGTAGSAVRHSLPASVMANVLSGAGAGPRTSKF